MRGKKEMNHVARLILEIFGKKLAKAGIESAASCSQVLYAWGIQDLLVESRRKALEDEVKTEVMVGKMTL